MSKVWACAPIIKALGVYEEEEVKTLHAKNHPDVSFCEPIMLPSRHGQSEPDINHLSFSHQPHHPSISNTFSTRNPTNDIRPGKRERKPGNRHYMWHEIIKQDLTESQTHNTDLSYAFQPRRGCGWLLAGHMGLRPEPTGGTCSQKGQHHMKDKLLITRTKLKIWQNTKRHCPNFKSWPPLHYLIIIKQ